MIVDIAMFRGAVGTVDVIIIDAEPHLPKLLSHVLDEVWGPDGLLLIVATDGREGLQAARQCRPSLVILDVALSGLDGYDICSALKGDAATAHATVVLLTTKGEVVDRVRGQMAGADHFLTKPFDPDELLAIATQALPPPRSPSSSQLAPARSATEGDSLVAAAIESYRDNALLHRATRTLNGSLAVCDVAEALLAEFRRCNVGQQGAVYALDDGGRSRLACFGTGAAELFDNFEQNSLFLVLAEIGASGVYNNIKDDVRTAEAAADLPFRSLLMLPLGEAGHILGLLTLVQDRDFTAFDLRCAETLTSLGSAAMQRARMFEQLRLWNAALEEQVAERTIQLADQNRRLADAQEVMTKELELANVLQQSILPDRFPVFPPFDGFATMTAARQVGGDFYDMFVLDDDRLAIAIADVSGKGVPAAFFMMQARSLLREVAANGLSPAICLREINERLCANNPLSLFVTLFYGILDRRSGTLTYANGGHEPPYRFVPGQPPQAIPKVQGMLVGLVPDIDYGDAVVALTAGEVLFLYTDGLSEAMNAADELFGHERIRCVLSDIGQLPPQELVSGIVAAVEQHAAGCPQSDDLTYLAVRYRPV
jgi:serine phosphatase RsbU (regulator of sigma subunit)/DNA-binding response OmpR family regulator